MTPTAGLVLAACRGGRCLNSPVKGLQRPSWRIVELVILRRRRLPTEAIGRIDGSGRERWCHLSMVGLRA